MKKQRVGKWNKTVWAMLLGASVLVSGCAGQKGTGSHTVRLQFSSYTTARSNKMLELVLPRAHAAVSSLKMCFKRLRFKASDTDTNNPTDAEDNIDFFIGEKVISGSSTDLGSITLKDGTYVRVEFDLEDSCGTGTSIQLANGNGNFSTDSRVTIKFSGTFNANMDGTLTLAIQDIMTALNAYNGAVSLKAAAEAASGQLSN